jgi:hypothetical protein
MSPYRRIDIDLRTEGLARLIEGYSALIVDKDRAESEKDLRLALDYLVDAFLEDRAGNADLFAICHKAGAVIEQEFGCWFKKDDQGRYSLPCPIFGLHSRLGFSPAFVTRGHCSLCGASDFECNHIHGRVYDGVRCARVVDEMRLDHMAVTNDPDFAYTFRNHTYFTEAEIIEMVGQDIPPGAGPVSNHCAICYGRNGPRPDDLDTTMWRRPGEEGAPENVEAPEIGKDSPATAIGGYAVKWGTYMKIGGTT